MPRKNTLPEDEASICRRVRAFRQFLNLNRIAFAVEAGLDSEILSRIENLRAPLRLGVFYKIASRYPINPQWLAEGIGYQTLSVDMPRLSSLKDMDAQTPFSLAYKGVFASVIQAQFKMSTTDEQSLVKGELGSSVSDRLVAAQFLSHQVKGWAARARDGQVENFVQELTEAAEQILRQHGQLEYKDFETRLRHMNMLEEIGILRGDVFPEGDQIMRYKVVSKPLLTTQADAVNSGGDMTAPTKSKALMARLRRFMTAQGLTQSAVASKLKVSRQAVHRWFRVKSPGFPMADVALRLDAWLRESGY